MDGPRDIARGLLGPAYQPLEDFASAAWGILDPRLDLQDFREGGAKISQGVRSGDPVQAASGVGQNLTGLLGIFGGGAMDAATAGGKMLMAFPVFHGTPHRYAAEAAFPQGRPRLDKMGTGEGAQAYGWGWYSAENPAVGRGYQKTLSAGTADLGGDIINPARDPDGAAKAWMERSVGLPDRLRSLVAEKLKMRLGADEIIDDLMIDDYGDFEGAVKDVLKGNPGQFYKFDIPDDVQPNLLDWDAPLSEQPESVQAAAKKLMPDLSSDEPHVILGNGETYHWSSVLGSKEDLNNETARRLVIETFNKLGKGGARWGTFGEKEMQRLTGAEFYNTLTEKMGALDWPVEADAALRSQFVGDAQARASDALRAAGVPGLRYFDGMSRNAKDGTRNYVIWDQGVLDRTVPLERNNKPTGLKPGDYGLLGTR